MKKTVAGLILLLTAAGCASLPLSDPMQSARPLDAYLLPTAEFGGGVAFHVNRPAHVAVFRIFPGQGASMVYPSPGLGSMNGRVYGGLHRADVGRLRNSAHYLPPSAITGPQFFLLIASDEPLDVQQFGPYGDGLSQAMGVRFASNAFSSMERLVSLVVPNVQSDGWVTDYYVHWPSESQNPLQVPLVQISCNGVAFVVPADRVEQAYEQLCPPEDETEVENGTEDSDAPDVVEPTRRAPVDIGERIASNQVQDRENWQEMRRAVAEGRWADVERRVGVVDQNMARPGDTFDDRRNDRLSRDRESSRSGARANRPPSRTGGSDGAATRDRPTRDRAPAATPPRSNPTPGPRAAPPSSSEGSRGADDNPGSRPSSND